MATSRKRWFRVADSVRRDTLGNDELAFMIRLMAEMNTRWARDGLSTEECSSIVLGSGDFIALTGSASLVRARRIAQRLSVAVSLTIDTQGANTRITWAKYAEFQHPDTPTRGKSRATQHPENAPSASASASASAERTQKKDSPAARARSVWPDLVEVALALGGSWRKHPGVKQLQVVEARIADGATEADLLDAVRGYIRKNGIEARGDFDPMSHFTATTVFRASKFDANLEAASRPARSQGVPVSNAQAKQDTLHESARVALEIFQNREAERLAKVPPLAILPGGAAS